MTLASAVSAAGGMGSFGGIQSARFVGSVESAAEVVRRLSDEAEGCLRTRPTELLHDGR